MKSCPLKVDIEVILYKAQYCTPKFLQSERFSGVRMTDPDEFRCMHYDIVLIGNTDAVLVFVKKADLEKFSFATMFLAMSPHASE